MDDISSNRIFKGKCMDAVQVDDANRKAGGFTHNIEVKRSDGIFFNQASECELISECDLFAMAPDK